MNPAQEAQNLLEEVGIDSLPIIAKDICQTLKIPYVEDPYQGFEGTFIYDPQGIHTFIGVNSNIREESRKNFTCAHELGHYCMDTLKAHKFVCSKDEIESPSSELSQIERRANQFAVELLMPHKIYRNLVNERDPGWDSFKELAKKSSTSLIATAQRYVNLTNHACILIVSKDKKIVHFQKSSSFTAYLEKTLSPQTQAHNAFLGKTISDSFETVKADNWLSGRNLGRDTEILEWTLPINSYGQVLTLLWNEEGMKGWSEADIEYDDETSKWETPTFHNSKRKR